jgi:hypothetical protein
VLELDMETNKKGIKDWIGWTLYGSIDVFMVGLMSQVATMPTRVPLYRKEKLSGMYSVHAYYLSYWTIMNLLLVQFPIIVSLLTFQFLGFSDSSFNNMLEHVMTYVLLCTVAGNFGFMWGCLFKNDQDALTSVILYMSLTTLGAG